MGLPYSKFFWADYLRDTRILSLEARGAWMDILCHLSREDEVGVAGYTMDSWARLLGVTKRQFKKVYQELTEAKVGQFWEKNGKFFVKNNRLCDDFDDYKKRIIAKSKGGKNSAKKQRKLREINESTPTELGLLLQQNTQEVLQQNNDVSSNTTTNTNPTILESHSLESHSLSKEREENHDDSIPTLEDVLTEASMRGIPEEHARSFFDYTDNKNLWLNQYGTMTKWRGSLKSWSERRRTIKNNGGSKNTNTINRNAGTANDGLANDYEAFAQQQHQEANA